MGALRGALDGFDTRWLHLELNARLSALTQTTRSATGRSFCPNRRVCSVVLHLLKMTPARLASPGVWIKELVPP
jgi:hypothetical protein